MRTNDPFSQPRKRHHSRTSGVKEANKKILIVCEDTKSGLYYLDALIVDLQLTAVKVGPCKTGTDPMSIVEYAKGQTNQYQQVWAVFDGDSALHGGQEKSKFDGAIDKAKTAPTINTYISVPCLEFWFILHYHFRSSPYQKVRTEGNHWSFCTAVCQDLAQKIPDSQGYKKSEKNIYERLKTTAGNQTGQGTAIRNALKLRNLNETNERYPHPSTEIDLLIAELHSINNNRPTTETTPTHPTDKNHFDLSSAATLE